MCSVFINVFIRIPSTMVSMVAVVAAIDAAITILTPLSF